MLHNTYYTLATSSMFTVVRIDQYDEAKHERVNINPEIATKVRFCLYADDQSTVGDVMDTSKHKIKALVSETTYGTTKLTCRRAVYQKR